MKISLRYDTTRLFFHSGELKKQIKYSKFQPVLRNERISLNTVKDISNLFVNVN